MRKYQQQERKNQQFRQDMSEGGSHGNAFSRRYKWAKPKPFNQSELKRKYLLFLVILLGGIAISPFIEGLKLSRSSPEDKMPDWLVKGNERALICGRHLFSSDYFSQPGQLSVKERWMGIKPFLFCRTDVSNEQKFARKKGYFKAALKVYESPAIDQLSADEFVTLSLATNAIARYAPLGFRTFRTYYENYIDAGLFYKYKNGEYYDEKLKAVLNVAEMEIVSSIRDKLEKIKEISLSKKMDEVSIILDVRDKNYSELLTNFDYRIKQIKTIELDRLALSQSEKDIIDKIYRILYPVTHEESVQFLQGIFNKIIVNKPEGEDPVDTAAKLSHAIMHAQLFPDANCRVARLISQGYLEQHGKNPVFYPDASEYNEVVCYGLRTNDPSKLVQYFHQHVDEERFGATVRIAQNEIPKILIAAETGKQYEMSELDQESCLRIWR